MGTFQDHRMQETSGGGRRGEEKKTKIENGVSKVIKK